MELNAKFGIKDTLQKAQPDRTRVAVHLRSGGVLDGPVADVGDHHVVIAELAGKEFYDALVRIDDISAVEVRARNS